MMFRAFSLKNILWGIFLGLVFVGVWMYYPNLSDRIAGSFPEVKKRAIALLRDQEERLKPYLKEFFIEPHERPEPLESGPSNESGHPKGVHEASSIENGPQKPGSESGMEPNHALEEKGMYPFLAFNAREIAEGFTASIKGSTGVDLRVRKQGHVYMVFIPAADEEERSRKAALIREKAGIHGR